MSSPHLESGRVNQKLRTREALLEAAEALVAAGGRPTVPEVAEAARVSLATAYRYFPSRELLLLEAVLARRSTAPEAVVPDAVRDPAERVAYVQRFVYDVAADNEANFRLYLAGTMQEWVRTGGEAGATLREGRRLRMLEHALAPARDRLAPETYALLRDALAGIVGMETYFALSDVCRLDRARATEVMGWAVATLVRAALDDAGAGPAAGSQPASSDRANSKRPSSERAGGKRAATEGPGAKRAAGKRARSGRAPAAPPASPSLP